MTYSLIAILAVLIHCIVNIDILDVRRELKISAVKYYRYFLYAAVIFHITDACWGFFYDRKLAIALYINTTIFFVALAISVLMWTSFVVTIFVCTSF